MEPQQCTQHGRNDSKSIIRRLTHLSRVFPREMIADRKLREGGMVEKKKERQKDETAPDCPPWPRPRRGGEMHANRKKQQRGLGRSNERNERQRDNSKREGE